MLQKNIYLIGFMGSGKSTVGKELGAMLPDFELIDMDQLIVDQEKRSIADIFSTDGEPYFRGLEHKLIQQNSKKNNKIVSTGGGVILNPENVRLMKESGVVFWLAASSETIYARIKDETKRPLINTGLGKKAVLDRINHILDSRFDIYKEAADVIINSDRLSLKEIVKEIIKEHRLNEKCL